MVISPHKSVQWFLVVSQFYCFLGSLLAEEKWDLVPELPYIEGNKQDK
jgi:hypothetical protein